MKKIAVLLLALSLMLFASIASAEMGYEDYWNGDRNYALIYGKMNMAYYVDKSSLRADAYNPPNYILGISYVTVSYDDTAYETKGQSGKKTFLSTKAHRFYYDISGNRKMYVEKGAGTGNWAYVNPTGSEAESAITMELGEAAFYLAYNMKFYGGVDYGKYQRNMGSAFYERLK